MAKDILAVSISSVGVKRLFSTARQICSYARNRFRPETIGKMMVVKHAEGYISQCEKGGVGYERCGQADRSIDNGHDGEGDYKVGEAQVISDYETEADKGEEEEDYEEEEEEEEEEVV
jgi:hypothetical protein